MADGESRKKTRKLTQKQRGFLMRDKGWVLTRLCQCCGKFIIRLKLPAFGSKTDPRWYIVCYSKGWDGNPWYVSDGLFGKNAYPHPTRRYARNMQEINPAPTPPPPEDPFFSLETSEET